MSGENLDWGALVVIIAQFGVSPEVLKVMARAGFMVLGFYVVWVVFRRLIKDGTSRYRMDPSIRQLVQNLFAVIAGLGIVGIAVGFAGRWYGAPCFAQEPR
ncbi:hypothetical protein [Marinobacter sp. es.048]|uniref:hypothetical protein n=1 Tax=Marinobacter sp. es.048 TaxID=1761795 RepID=UPI001E4D4DC5|nr:hypothetical protein [Marinobacter sp. es.048]